MRSMRLGLFAVLAICAALLWGCSAGQQQVALSGAGVVSTALSVDQVVQSGDLERAVFSIALSDADVVIVRAALVEYADVRATLLSLGESPERLLDARATLDVLHVRLSAAYDGLHGVVARNWSGYSAVNQSWLSRWQGMAERYVIQRNGLLAALDGEISADVRKQRAVEIARLLGQFALVSRPLWAGQ